jgi:hypothetical protein
MNLQTGWLYSFSLCHLLHKTLEYVGFSPNISNVISCISFQVYISFKTAYILISGHGTGVNVLHNLYGYFLYDLACLTLNDYSKHRKMFIIHHIVSCIIINTVLSSKIGDDFHLLMFVFLSESPTPYVNMRILLGEYPLLKRLNKKFTKYYYFLCRIVLLPVSAIGFMNNFSAEPQIYVSIYISFFMLYFMSINWFITMIKN